LAIIVVPFAASGPAGVALPRSRILLCYRFELLTEGEVSGEDRDGNERAQLAAQREASAGVTCPNFAWEKCASSESSNHLIHQWFGVLARRNSIMYGCPELFLSAGDETAYQVRCVQSAGV